MVRPSAAAPRPTRAELVAALSLAIDLGLGQPMEHMLRSCLIAMRLADLVDADAVERETAYYGGLLAWIGCHADSQEFAELFGDDIAFRAASYEMDWRGPEFATLLMRYVGSVRPLPARAVRLLDFVVHARPQLTAMIASHCVSASALAARLGLPDRVTEGLAFTFERWDGSGLPTGAAGDAIPLGMRLVHLADVAEVHLRHGGPEAAVAMARDRRGTQLDPHLVDVFCRHVADVVPGGGDSWERVIALAPDAGAPLGTAEADAVLEAIGDFVDLKSPWTAGHSRAVVGLAVGAGRALGLGDPELADLARAARVMDLGLMGVPNRVWRRTSILSPAEAERLRLHPYFTRRILSRVAALEPLSRPASSHHERLDGSGYPQGTTAPQLGIPERILAAAEQYRSLREPHPLRAALPPGEAATALRDDVRAGRLDGPAVEAVLAAAGTRPAGRPAWPAGLTGREVTVLRGIAQGRTAGDVAGELHISPKTAQNHIEHIYRKIGASNRTGAALFAVSHGLLGEPE